MSDTLTPHAEDQIGMSLAQLVTYLESTGWRISTTDDLVSSWTLESAAGEALRIVLPREEEFLDRSEMIARALHVLAWGQQRAVAEILEDIHSGGVDVIAVRTHPGAVPGQVLMGDLRRSISALRDLVVASASAELLAEHPMVLPTRRPRRAEIFADRVKVSTRPGSFILQAALPLYDELDEQAVPQPTDGEALFDQPVTPFGRTVHDRIHAVARYALEAADAVAAGDLQISHFMSQSQRIRPNATELAALAGLGGSEKSLYELRFAATPLLAVRPTVDVVVVTPGRQRVLGDVADFLRTRAARPDVTVMGLVIRLTRVGALGPGEIVVLGPDDDTGIARRLHMQLSENDYGSAVRAHREGLRICARGDVVFRGNHRYLTAISAFDVIPGLDDD